VLASAKAVGQHCLGWLHLKMEDAMAFYDWVSDSMIDDTDRLDAVRVGWVLTSNAGSVLFDDPERFRSADLNRDHAKSASRCPAVINLESRYFVVKCPFSLHLGFERDNAGKPCLKNRMGDKSQIRNGNLAQHVILVAEPEWRHKNRPTIQIKTPYMFVADEPVFVSQLPPFMHYLQTPWPGTLFGGRFPIHVWPRPLMWAFEWHDQSKDLILRRGDPWFYVEFETLPADRAVTLVQAQMTPELEEYTQQLTGVVSFSNQTFSLFKTAEKRRPKVLLKAAKDD
jgi:hypothetical protein